MIFQNMPESPVVPQDSREFAMAVTTIQVHISNGKKSTFVTPVLIEQKLTECTAEELNRLKLWLTLWLEKLESSDAVERKKQIEANSLIDISKGCAVGAVYGGSTAYALQALVGTLSSFSFWGCVTAGSCIVGGLHSADVGEKIIHISNVIEAKSRLRETITVIDGVLSAMENNMLRPIDDKINYLAKIVETCGIDIELEIAQKDELRWRNRRNRFGSP